MSMKSIARAAAVAAVCCAAAGVSGCARVAPYQRETLARRQLQQPPYPQLERRAQHMFTVREGTRGASGAAGGGCGCN